MKKTDAFTLTELLVVLAIVGILSVITVPALRYSIGASQRSQCASNLRQLFLANQLYANDHGRYVAAAEDMFYSGRGSSCNTKRWHGERPSGSKPFDGALSPLAAYLGKDKKIRTCPALKDYSSDPSIAFEASCGGYGYNDRGVGSQAYKFGFNGRACSKGMPPGAIKKPAQTVMFADAAFLVGDELIEYSFAESYNALKASGTGHDVNSTEVAKPSIHFRHGDKANVVWCDGHTSCEKMTIEGEREFTERGIGWFGERNNELFDPY